MRRLWLVALLWSGGSAHAGYDHYWKWVKEPDPEKLKACIKEMAKVLDSEKAMIAGPEGKGPFTLKESALEFNGIGEDSCEPFAFPGRMDTNSCKTNWQYYDRVVIACLLIARDHFGEDTLLICSDGQWPIE